ncbi:benzoate/H(+) symporter BenE family transporter [Sneathiella sp. P13V-1]|uniref:benzoate/H(+) symporter BenE family transporter n=1 Tax=Sneathiella sp. P13V-1 TaxID=2697366 RepID=UPI00187B6617|nr:benzoate/H(+) symporter BenE family transporter [Sneathiella sp. P13V-1]MBE7638620.1 benzoate/H(+) symporter BenE family transporter [Sneathiella sp. P13V-1]
MRSFFSLPHITSGFVAVLVGYTSAGAIVFQAAQASGASTDQIASWMWAVGVGMGLCGLFLSIRYKAPILIAWSTPGAALLITSLEGLPMGEAIGAFLFSSTLLTICGFSGWFDKILKVIPTSLATGMLAGVLLRFALNAFGAMESSALLVGGMLLAYLIGKRFNPVYAVPLTLITGVLIAFSTGQFGETEVSLDPTIPVWMAPEFSISSLIGVGIPLFIVTMASQNLPGIATLRAHGYQTPASPLIGWSGLTGLLLAPFGGFAFNLGAITAAICMGETTNPDPSKRYHATIWAGIFYIIMGIFGGVVTGLFILFPDALVMAIAGIALMGTISNSLISALSNTEEREAAFITFAITASGLTFFTIGAPFWGIVIGTAIHFFNSRANRRT